MANFVADVLLKSNAFVDTEISYTFKTKVAPVRDKNIPSYCWKDSQRKTYYRAVFQCFDYLWLFLS